MINPVVKISVGGTHSTTNFSRARSLYTSPGCCKVFWRLFDGFLRVF